MIPSEDLINEVFLDKIRAAREMSVDQRLSAGGPLFDYACAAARMGIRLQHPSASAEQVEELLGERIKLMRRLEGMSVGERTSSGGR